MVTVGRRVLLLTEVPLKGLWILSLEPALQMARKLLGFGIQVQDLRFRVKSFGLIMCGSEFDEDADTSLQQTRLVWGLGVSGLGFRTSAPTDPPDPEGNDSFGVSGFGCMISGWWCMVYGADSTEPLRFSEVSPR